MSATEQASKTPVEILTLTRDIFRASHWVMGEYVTSMWTDNVILLPEDEGGSTNYKAVGCSIGGMRYAALAPMDHALDEAWMVSHFEELGSQVIGHKLSDEANENYLAALVCMCKEITVEEIIDSQLADADREGEDIYSKIAWMEDRIVSWNDSFDYDDEQERLDIVAGSILPMFDAAIGRAIAQEGGSNGNG